MISLVQQAFSSSGLLSKVLDGYAPRQAQIDMAVQVDKTIERQSSLVVEAGTGTGKTFAYLIPSLLSNKKVIVSTGTKNLQEQLFFKDIPLIKNALATNIQVALLKGRANYLCHYRLDLYTKERGQLDAEMLADFVNIRSWATATRSGDISELVNVAEGSAIFPYVTSTVDNCLAKDCPNFEQCFLVNARKKAIEADVVVVNHHLFFADMALKDTGFGELIPKAEVVIFDEAHQIPDIASEYFGDAFSTRQIMELCSDVLQVYHAQLTDVKQLGKAAEKLRKSAQEFRLLFAYDAERGNWREKMNLPTFSQAFSALKIELDFLYQVIKICISRNEAIDNCFERLVNIQSKFDLMANVNRDGMSFWYETTRKHVVLHLTPLSIAEKFQKSVNDTETGWVFTSATLAVNDSFTHFTDQLGLGDAKTLLVDSPFNYLSQSQLVVPRYLPQANDKQRAQALMALSLPLILASKGSCFLLFTSYRMLNQVAELLSECIDTPLLVQGQMGKRLLLEAFIDDPSAVLLATSSFWEGVDVRGNNLTCVIIDKLPFASPDDPLLQARSEDIRRQGLDPFKELQLPQAVIALKQGVGRLIRDITDRGVMVICDDRLVNRPYGEVFLNSLPNMKRSRDVINAGLFLKDLHQSDI